MTAFVIGLCVIGAFVALFLAALACAALLNAVLPD